MPSKDPINQKANAWLSGQERPSATEHLARGATASQTGRRGLSSVVLRLASRLGIEPEELADRIPADTLRRLKYPVIETVEEDGSRSYKDDKQVMEGRSSLPQIRR